MRKFLAAAAVATVFVASSAQASVQLVASVPRTTPYTGPTTFNFDTTVPANGSSCGTGPISDCIKSGTTGGSYASPYLDDSNYLTVTPNANDGAGIPATASSAIVKLSQAGVYWLSFTWGSVDTYNFVDFLDSAGQVLATFSGADVSALANGDQSDPATNPRVIFGFHGTDAARVAAIQFRSTSNAFEIDDIRVVGVPELATWAMMIIGFGMIGGVLRRRSTKVSYA